MAAIDDRFKKLAALVLYGSTPGERTAALTALETLRASASDLYWEPPHFRWDGGPPPPAGTPWWASAARDLATAAAETLKDEVQKRRETPAPAPTAKERKRTWRR